MSEGLVKVCCQDCGAELGYQGGTSEDQINWELWKHSRCPVRLARGLKVTDEEYEQAVAIATVAIRSAYPEFPNNQLDKRMVEFQHMRARIAAECVMECLGVVGFNLTKPAE